MDTFYRKVNVVMIDKKCSVSGWINTVNKDSRLLNKVNLPEPFIAVRTDNPNNKATFPKFRLINKVEIAYFEEEEGTVLEGGDAIK